ncbi:hypothetical protein 3 [Hubei tombus-like virus 40]|uniref:hypothetical protein 3 n=1 Tax=Hubei tombus-like virus 40 TaxID=1923289 RepID=UPI00090A945D|nr:hypothetical protein 3 [Hubei tombus-like virus 40]APG76318.1 hypothetical protein 3 [Hubei tombus-like virus 40]
MPALTSDLVTAPAKSLQNMITGLETRVLNLVPKTSPLLAPSDEVAIIVVAVEEEGHPLSYDNHLDVLPCLGYRVIPMDRALPPPRPFETMVDLQPVMDRYERQIRYNQKRGWKTVILYRNGILLPGVYPRETGCIWRLRRTIDNGVECYYTTVARSNSTIVRHPLINMQVEPYSTELQPPVAGLHGELSKVTVTMPCRRKDNPLKAGAREFVRTEEMAWLGDVVAPVPFNEWVKRYPLKRREQLSEAHDRLLQLGMLGTRESIVKNFLKIETTTKGVDCRNISPRSDVFLACVGPYIAAVEHEALNAPFLVKGRNIRARDKWMGSLSRFSHFIEIDFARFDMTLSKELLENVEHELLLRPFSEDQHALFHIFMKMALRTKGVSEFGTSYRISGTRCSGDAHTSIGNGLLNRFAIWWCLRYIPEQDWVSFHEGDDGVIGLVEGRVDEARAALESLWCLGLQAKIDVYHDLSQTSFCGRFMADTASGMMSYCDPLRALAKFHTTVSDGDPKALMLAKALSYYSTDRNTPVVGVLCYALITILRPEVTAKRLRKALRFNARNLSWFAQYEDAEDFWQYWRRGVTRPCCDILRPFFALRSGVSIREQQSLEQMFDNWVSVGYVPGEFGKIPVDWTPLAEHKWVTMRTSDWVT